jgi:hypothetical protein
MFEKFDNICKASVEYYAKDKSSESNGRKMIDILNQLAKEFGNDDFMNRKTRLLIEALPKIDQVELTGIVFYGRDAAVTKDTREITLQEYTTDHAYMVDEDGHADYLSGKPIHLYLESAKDKLRGQRDTTPEPDERSEEYSEESD